MDIQTNGSSHPGGTQEHGGAQIVPMIIGGGDSSGGDGAPFTEAVSETASRLHEQVDDNMQELRSKAAALDHSIQQQQEAAQRSEAQLQDVQQQLQGVLQQMQSLDQRLQGIEQSLRSGEQVVADLGEQVNGFTRALDEQVTGFTRALDEQGGKVTNVSTSIGELSQEITELKQMQGPVAAVRDDLDVLKTQGNVTSRRWIVTLVAFIVIVGGYIALDKPGWTMVMSLIPGVG